MSKSRVGPEAKIINLFAALSEDSRRIVLDVIKSQAAAPRKVKAATNKPSTATQGAKEPTAGRDLKCGTCGNPPDHADHDRTYLKSHDFEPPKAARKKREKKETPAVIPIEGQGVDLAAEMES
jgi:hypothetical protein